MYFDAWDYGYAGKIFFEVYKIDCEGYFFDMVRNQGVLPDDAYKDMESKLLGIYNNIKSNGEYVPEMRDLTNEDELLFVD